METDNAYPDITLLPKLAEIFGCSVDHLLGYDMTCQKSVADIISEANRLRKELKSDEAVSLLTQALARYPANTQLMFELARHKYVNARYKDKSERDKMLHEAEELFSYVAEHETHKNRRAWSLYFLTQISIIKNDYDAASAFNEKLLAGDGLYPQVTQAIIEMKRNSGEKAYRSAQNVLYSCIAEYSLMLEHVVRYLSETGNNDAVIRECTRAAKVFEEFTDCGWIYRELAMCSKSAALAYANKKDYDACLDALEKACECAVRYDEQDWNLTYDIFRILDGNEETEEKISSRKSMLRALTSIERSAYDPIRNTERYKAILEKLNIDTNQIAANNEAVALPS